MSCAKDSQNYATACNASCLNQPMQCGDDYPGCNLCYCSAVNGTYQKTVACTGDPSSDGNGCGFCSSSGSASQCTGNTSDGGSNGGCTSDGKCYSCNAFDANGTCTDMVETDCADGGLSMSCPSGASGCSSESFSTPRRFYARPVYARTRTMFAPHPSRQNGAQARHLMYGPTVHHPGPFPTHTRPPTTHHARTGPTPRGPATVQGFAGVAARNDPHAARHNVHHPSMGMSGQDRAHMAERMALAERRAWMTAAPSDGSYTYNAEEAMTADGDLMQYHRSGCSGGAFNHAQYIEDLAFGQETRLNHARWASEVSPWSGGRARIVDTFEDENYVNWVGLRGPHRPVEVANPSQVTELDPEDLTNWGSRMGVQSVGTGAMRDCVYRWKD